MSDAKEPTPKKPRKPATVKPETPKEGASKAIVPAPEKKTHKLTPQHVQVIVDLALNGYTVEATRKYILDQYGISITAETVFYNRRREKEKMLQAISDEIALARANVPELATLTGRLAGLQAIIEKEKKKKRGSAYALTQAFATAASDMHHAQVLALRMRESLAKYPEHKEGESERVLQELERRSHLMRDVTERTERIYAAAEEEFVASNPDKPVVIEGEVVEDEEGNPPESPDSSTDRPGGGAEGLGEDVLQG